jgi:hypothetical protein
MTLRVSHLQRLSGNNERLYKKNKYCSEIVDINLVK